MAATKTPSISGNDRVLEALRRTGLKPEDIYEETENFIRLVADENRIKPTASLSLSSNAEEVLRMAQAFRGRRKRISDLDLSRGLVKAVPLGLLEIKKLKDDRSLGYLLLQNIDQIEKEIIREPDWKLSISQMMKDRWTQDEHRKKVAAARTKTYSDPEKKAQIHKAMHTKEANRNRSDGLKKFHQDYPEKRFEIGRKIGILQNLEDSGHWKLI